MFHPFFGVTCFSQLHFRSWSETLIWQGRRWHRARTTTIPKIVPIDRRRSINVKIFVCHGHFQWTLSCSRHGQFQRWRIRWPIIRSARSDRHFVHRAHPFQNDHYRWNTRIFQRHGFTWFQINQHDFKFGDRRCVPENSLVFARGAAIDRRTPHAVGQHAYQIVHVFEFGCQTSTHLIKHKHSRH
jgi:hypothetical protein